MTIDIANFTPWLALAGGVCIGLAALLLMAANGRVMGISGILGSIVRGKPSTDVWRYVFVLGVMVGAWGYGFFFGVPTVSMVAQSWQLYAAALLVGIGSALGSGCTSGHGICGLARFSPRSLVAVVVFMVSAMVTAYLTLHWL